MTCSFKTKTRLNAPAEERLLHVPSKRMEVADTRPRGSSDGLGKQDTSHLEIHSLFPQLGNHLYSASRPSTENWP